MKIKLNMIDGNSNPCYNRVACINPLNWCSSFFDVPQNHFALVTEMNSTGKKTLIYGPGYHSIGYFYKL